VRIDQEERLGCDRGRRQRSALIAGSGQFLPSDWVRPAVRLPTEAGAVEFCRCENFRDGSIRECRFKSEIQRKTRQDSLGADTVARDATQIAARDHPDCLASLHDG
jgi:hypothetical protein